MYHCGGYAICRMLLCVFALTCVAALLLSFSPSCSAADSRSSPLRAAGCALPLALSSPRASLEC